MKIPEDTPVEISPGVWSIFGDPAAYPARLPLDTDGMELLRRHHRTAEQSPDSEWQSWFRVGRTGRMFVVIVRTTWWPEPRESSPGFLGPTARFIPSGAHGPGPLTFMCLEDEWEALIGKRPEIKRWPRDN